LPTRCIDAAGATDWLRGVLGVWIAEKLGVSTFSAVSFALHFRHLMSLSAASNAEVLVHARCTSDNWFRLMAASSGLDLPSVMRRILPMPVGDLVAMARATEACSPLHGSDFTDLGSLQRLLHEVVEGNLGFVTLHSGFVLFSYACNDTGLMKKLELTHAFFPGFLVECGLKTGALSPTATFNEPVALGTSMI
jgi:hypothetical protein